LPTRYAELPEIGRLTGRGTTVNLENVVRLAPDLVLDVGNTTATYVSLADQVQEQTRVPAVLIASRRAGTAATMRIIGGLLGVSQRAEALAGYAEAVLGGAREAVAKIPTAERPSIYIARGPHGLETAVAGSIGSEVELRCPHTGGVGDTRPPPRAGYRLLARTRQIGGPRPATLAGRPGGREPQDPYCMRLRLTVL
jgi:iron complex transport system substrate-binding protein